MTRPLAMENAGKLGSWKEIAEHLGKSVRTVQRWEAEYGLPVHRLPGKKKDTVYAFCEELDAWLKNHAGALHELVERGAQGDSRSAQHPGAAGGVRRRRVTWMAVAGGLALALTLGAGYVWFRRPAQPVTVEVKGNRLIVYDASHRQLWSYPFDLALNEQTYPQERTYRVPELRAVLLDDIDRDGNTEVVLRVITAQEGAAEKRVLVCIDSRGTLRWQYQPSRSVRFGDEIFEAPFIVDAFQVTANGQNKPHDIWVVSHHQRWFPSVVAKLDARGNVFAEFWNAGHIHTLAQARVRGRPVMLAGGTNNEYITGALAVLDYDQPSGSSPGEKEAYHCRSCPAGSPLLYMLFPRSELSRVLDTRQCVQELSPYQSGDIVVGLTDEWSRQTGELYSFDSLFHLKAAEIAEYYGVLHNQLQARGTLKHAMDRTQEAESLKAVRYWDGKQFTTNWVPPH